MVPVRFSSANRRIVIMGMKNSPMTLTFDSSGLMICSFTFIGNVWPRICDAMPSKTKKPSAFQKKKPKITANMVSNRYAIGETK